MTHSQQFNTNTKKFDARGGKDGAKYDPNNVDKSFYLKPIEVDAFAMAGYRQLRRAKIKFPLPKQTPIQIIQKSQACRQVFNYCFASMKNQRQANKIWANFVQRLNDFAKLMS
jgi:hypothetical protein